MTYACQYSIVQFLPFVETGEFANVGVALTCPELGYFDFRIKANGWRRICTFFAPLDRHIYRACVDRLTDELTRVKALTELCGDLKATWAELVRHRNGIIRYASPRAILADAPSHTLADLFARYVEHEFVTQEYQERRLEQTVKELLTGAAVAKAFHRERLGDQQFLVTLPFVETAGGRAVKVIKPLYLAQQEPTKILVHGGDWLARLRKLRKRDCLPAATIIAVERPAEDAPREAAFQEACEEFRAENFIVTEVVDREYIVQFAREGLEAAGHTV